MVAKLLELRPRRVSSGDAFYVNGHGFGMKPLVFCRFRLFSTCFECFWTSFRRPTWPWARASPSSFRLEEIAYSPPAPTPRVEPRGPYEVRPEDWAAPESYAENRWPNGQVKPHGALATGIGNGMNILWETGGTHVENG